MHEYKPWTNILPWMSSFLHSYSTQLLVRGCTTGCPGRIRLLLEQDISLQPGVCVNKWGHSKAYEYLQQGDAHRHPWHMHDNAAVQLMPDTSWDQRSRDEWHADTAQEINHFPWWCLRPGYTILICAETGYWWKKKVLHTMLFSVYFGNAILQDFCNDLLI